MKEMIDELVQLAVYKGKREQTKKDWVRQDLLTEKELEEFDAEIADIDAEIEELKQKILQQPEPKIDEIDEIDF